MTEIQHQFTMTGSSDPVISIARTAEEKERIFRFRYAIYVEEMGKTVSSADHSARLLFDELDEWATIYYASQDGQVIAAARSNQCGVRPFPERYKKRFQIDHFADFPLSAMSYSSRLMVARKWRHTMITAKLSGYMYRHGRKQGIRFDFVNARPALVELYERLGFRRYTNNFSDKDAGYQIPMVLLAEDIVHLKAVRSPFYRIAKRMDNPDVTRKWFFQNFPEHAHQFNRCLMGTEHFWQLLTSRLHSQHVGTLPLLRSLTEKERQTFLGTCTVLKCRRGETIIRPGEQGNELFVLLSGIVEVRGEKDGKSYSLASFGPGQIFGEISFISSVPRTACINALTDIELIVLTQDFLMRLTKSMPEIASKVLLNLSLLLCKRLQTTTRNWLDLLETQSNN